MTQPLAIPISEAAARLGISVPTYRRHAKAGTLPLLRLGRRELVPVAALEAYVAASWQAPKPATPRPAPQRTRERDIDPRIARILRVR